MKKFLFNSSLPRSGSTILQNVFAQNPDFYCTPTSGTLELLIGSRYAFTTDTTFKAQDKDKMNDGFKNFCYQGLNGFYDAITDAPIILEKSRGWSIHSNFLQFIFDEKPKMVCMVRDLKQIISSMELKFRNNQHLDSGIVNHGTMTNTTTEKRVDYYFSSAPVGIAMERLKDIFTQNIHQHIFFMRYEDFCRDPKLSMDQLYNHFDLPPYDHDFKNVVQKTQEDDSVFGIFGDHTITPRIKLKDNNPTQVLGQNICQWIDNHYKWYNDIFKY